MKPSSQRRSKPSWLKKALPPGGKVGRIEKLVRDHDLNTVCHGAKCPNRNECYHKGTATFLILGDVCSRRCRFCSIPKEAPAPVDPEEPRRLARAVKKMGLTYAVITSVTRDDLEDGGASHFVKVIRALEAEVAGIGMELLVPDFGGSREALDAVLSAGPTVLNHNVETVPSLYPRVRPGAEYARSLALLEQAAAIEGMPVKSGLMVGLGEKEEEVAATLQDLRRCGVGLLTLGQYLQPGPDCLEVQDYITPDQFDRYARMADELGFSAVASGPFVRSSHQAAELFARFKEKGRRP